MHDHAPCSLALALIGGEGVTTAPAARRLCPTPTTAPLGCNRRARPTPSLRVATTRALASPSGSVAPERFRPSGSAADTSGAGGSVTTPRPAKGARDVRQQRAHPIRDLRAGLIPWSRPRVSPPEASTPSSPSPRSPVRPPWWRCERWSPCSRRPRSRSSSIFQTSLDQSASVRYRQQRRDPQGAAAPRALRDRPPHRGRLRRAHLGPSTHRAPAGPGQSGECASCTPG